MSEEVKDAGPDGDEKEDNKESDAPGRDMLRGPEVQPVAAIGGGEKVVLDNDDDEEPLWGVLV